MSQMTALTAVWYGTGRCPGSGWVQAEQVCPGVSSGRAQAEGWRPGEHSGWVHAERACPGAGEVVWGGLVPGPLAVARKWCSTKGGGLR